MFLAIVPAYNEEKTIGSVVRSLFPFVDRVVVVDDCSTDTTIQEARKAGAHVLRHKINLGQGAALETGHAYARSINTDYVLHFDGDGQFDVIDISPALKYLQKNNADILFGSRFLDSRSRVPRAKKYFILPIARFINNLFGGLRLTDVHNGFRILNKKALDTVMLTQDRMAHATEIVSLIKKNKLKYVEFPVKVVYHVFGQRTSGGFKIIKDLVIGKFVK